MTSETRPAEAATVAPVGAAAPGPTPPAAAHRLPGWATYHPPAQPAGPPPAGRRRRAGRWLVAAAALLVALALAGSVAFLGVQLSATRAELRRAQEQALAATAERQRLTDQLLAQTAAVNGLSDRLGRLEARVADQPDPARVVTAVEPSVFTVQAGAAIGSAFAFARLDRGRVGLVTNFHVIEAAAGRRVPVVVSQGNRRFDATIERVHPNEDLALLGVSADVALLPKADRLPAVGDPVLAFGSPLGLGGSASTGIVSALRAGRIQFSAPVSPGNSGGPLVDRQGKVIGVTASKLVERAAEGLSFAIPIETVCSTVVAC